jgi:hypothetical protein
MKSDHFKFWHWFFRGSGGKPGFRRLLNRWVVFHAIVGFTLACVVDVELVTAASAVLLPLAGIFVGLSFAWVGNAQALMQSDEINQLADQTKGGFVEYVFTFQSAILIILVTLILWGLAGLKVFDTRWPTPAITNWYFGVKAILFTMASMTLRECWHVVMGAQWMLIAQREIKNSLKK